MLLPPVAVDEMLLFVVHNLGRGSAVLFDCAMESDADGTPELEVRRNLRESLRGSAGDVVYGMEDGAVSIFGLVLGVAVGAQSGSAVFLAGATECLVCVQKY